MLKKILCVITAVAVAAAMLTTTLYIEKSQKVYAEAAGTQIVDENGWTYVVNALLENGKPTVTLVLATADESSGAVVIPETVTSEDGTTYTVTKIGSGQDFTPAIDYWPPCTSVTIPNTVTTIGDAAFNGCDLPSVTIPNSVTSIGDYAFFYCSSLTSVTFEDNSQLTSIGESAFGNSGLTSVTIPDSVTSIGNSSFEYCYSLTSVTFGNNSQLTSIGESAFSRCGLTAVTIPDSVTSIGNYAFSGCNRLTAVKISESVTSIGDSAFSYSGLTSVTIPDSVTSIGNSAFSGCSQLASVNGSSTVTIPNSVKSLGNGVFSSCNNLNNIYWVNSNDNTVALCSYKTTDTAVTIPSTVKVTINDVEKDYTVTEIRGGSNTSVLSNASSCTSVTIPSTVTTIGDSAFRSCSKLASVTFDDNSQLTLIGDSAFGFCQELTSVTIPDSVTSIGKEAFYYCSGLTSVTIPEGVTSIGNSAFEGCSKLTSITFDDDSQLTSIGAFAFAYCSELTSVTIPDSVISIGNNAFLYSSKLAAVTIPDNVTSIGDYAFNYCSSLTSVTFGDNSQLTLIGNSAFGNCSFDSFEIPNSVTSIGEQAFVSCTNLASITIPDSVISISRAAFYNCRALTSVTISNSVVLIGGLAFRYSGLTEIEIPNSVKLIGDDAFPDSINITYDGTKEQWEAVQGHTQYTPVKYNITSTGNALLPAPNNLRYEIKDGYVVISWDAVEGAEYYQIMYRFSTGSWQTNRIRATTADGKPVTSITLKNLVQGKKYEYTVSAVDNDGHAGKLALDPYGDFNSFNIVVADDSSFDPNTSNDTPPYIMADYKVEHYKQNPPEARDVDGYTLEETETFTGKVDEYVTAEPKTYDGMVVNTEKSTLSGEINADGSLVLEVYYDWVTSTPSTPTPPTPPTPPPYIPPPDSSSSDSSEPDSSEPESSNPDSSEPESSQPDTSEPDTTEPESIPQNPQNPPTGMTAFLVPAVLAGGAAVLATMKRKKK